MRHLLEYTKWNSDTTGDPGDDYNYQYVSKDKLYYGVHLIQIQYEGLPFVSVEAKFDSGAKTSSISYELGKRMGVPDSLFQIAQDLEEEKIDKSIPEKVIKEKLDSLETKYPGISFNRVKSASGSSIRVYFPVTLFFNGRTIMTQANMKNRSGMKCEMIVGISDML